MAVSLLCGGLGVASAADGTVHVEDIAATATSKEVYTAGKVDTLLADYGKKSDVENNRNSITTMNTTITTQGQSIATNVANIANNTKAIEKKIDTEAADLKYATKEALADKADQTTVTALDGRVGDVEGKVTVLEKTVGNATSGLVRDVNDLNTALGTKANQSDLVDATNRIAVNEGEITALKNKTGKLSADGKELKDMTTVSGATVSGTNVEAGALKVTGAISDGAGVNTTLADIKASMTQTATNEANIATLQTTTAGQADAIKDLKVKTTNISYDSGKQSTSINGIEIGDTQVDMNGKNLTNVGTINGIDLGTKQKGNYISQDGSIWGNMLEVDDQVKTNADNIETNKNAITALDTKVGEIDDRTGGIKRNAEGNQTTIEDKVTVNKSGDVGGVKGLSAETINTTDDAKVGGALNVTGASDLKGNVTLGTPNGTNTVMVNGTANFNAAVNMDKGLTVNGKSDFKEAVEMDNGLTVTNGATSLKETTVNGKLTAKENATFEKNVTVEKDLTVNGKLNVDKISMKNAELKNGKKHDSATTITADEISNLAKVTDEKGNTTESQFTHNEKGTFNYAKDEKITGEWKGATSNVTADGVSNKMTDSDGNTHTYYQTATETREQLVNGDKSKSNFEKKTAEGNTISITEKDADGNLKSSLTNTQTVNGEKTSVTNKDSSSTIKQGADQIRYNVTSKDENKTSSSIEVKADGITNTSKDGTITNTAKNVTNVGTESVTNSVGANEVKVSTDGVDITAEAGKKITESVGTASRVVENDKIADNAGGSTVTTEKGKGTTFGKEGSTGTTNIYGDSIKTGTINAEDTTTGKLTAGAAADADGGRLTVDANEGVKGSYTFGDYTSRSYILPNTLMSGVDNGKKPTDADFVGSRTDHYMDEDKAKLDETVKDADGSNVTKKTSTKTYTEIKDTNGNTNHVTNSATQSKQTLKDKDGNTLTTNQTATKNNFDLKSADGSKENHTTNTVDESRVAIKGENGKAELSTTDEGTTFKHSAAKKAFTEGGATNTTIKGNTITTGKVTMDYADVMKDLGVRGNATVDKDMTVKGNTTLGEAGKDTTLTVNSKATFNEIATFENGAEVKNGLTVSSGGLNVTGESTFNDKVTMKNGLDVTGGVASDSFTVKGTDIKIDSSGINAGGTVISNVADGSISEGSKDAVNGGQLYQVKNDLEGKVNKVGANAAAMANLHPMEFDPDSKWNIAAAMGNYGSETATAIGAFYRPNEDVMVNFSTAFGTGENMVGGGVSVRLGKGGNKLSREESNALKDQVNDLTARMDALLSVLNPNMSKDFPDVPENHWAYEAVSRLAGNDIVQGYPDGEFHGDRTMTRYEMAEIIYNALSRGAEAERELVEEFKPELQAMAASEKATAERAEG